MPDWREEIRSAIRPLGLDPHREGEIVEELAADLEERHRDLIRSGLDGGTAAARIREEQLSPTALAEALSTTETPAPAPAPALGQATETRRLAGIGADLRYAVRSLRKQPALTLVAILTLALGIGGNAAIFTVVNAALVQPLRFPDPDRLVTFWGTAPDKGLPVVNYPDALYDHYQRRARGLTAIALLSSNGVTLSDKGEAIRVQASTVTAGFFEMLGGVPIAGRVFRADEARQGAAPVAILSWALWQDRFGGAPLIGQSVVIDDQTRTIVGIMSPGFDFPNRSRLWTPAAIDPQSLNCWCYDAIGRLGGGQTPESVAREIDALNDDFWVERENRPRKARGADDPPGTIVVPLAQRLAREIRTPALILLGAVAMVLLIACANLANLLLARATERSREIAVRSALGASPGRIRRQLVTESALLAVAGAAVGLGLARVMLGPIAAATVERLSHLDTIRLDPTVLGFTVLLTVATTLLFGLVPAIRATRLGTAAALRDGQRGTTDRIGRQLVDGFAAAQLALALILLVGAGLLLRSFAKLTAIDPGFRAEGVVVGRIDLPWTRLRERADTRPVLERIVREVAALPGVEAAGVTTTAPFGAGNNQQEVVVEGREPVGSEPVPVASIRVVSTGYFAAIGTPLHDGRVFEATDRDSSENVVVIDESLARRYWPEGGAVGRRIHLGSPRNERSWRRIVGVVASVRHGQLGTAPDHYVYLPLAQTGTWSVDLVVRGSGTTAATAGIVRAAMARIEPERPFYDVRTMEEAVDRSLSTRRLTDLLLVGFAGMALLLSAIGVYGVISRSVAARGREFGVRLALGASPARIRNDVLRQGLRLVAMGTVIGAIGAVALASVLGALLYQVGRFDPPSFLAAALALGTIALVACYLPAVRATRADPVSAMRDE